MASSSTASGANALQVSDLTIALVVGTASDLVAKWHFSKGHVDHFDVTWSYYNTKKNGWIVGSTTSAGTTKVGGYFQSTWTAPSNASATKARVTVKPVSRKDKEVKYKDSKGNEKTKTTTWWTADGMTSKALALPSALPTPDRPSAPTATLNSDDTITVTLTHSDSKATHVIVQRKVDSGSFAKAVALKRTTNGAYSWKDSTAGRGHTYQYRAYGHNETSGKSSQASDAATVQGRAGAMDDLSAALSSINTQDDSGAVKLRWRDSGTIRGTVVVEYSTYNVWSTNADDKQSANFTASPDTRKKITKGGKEVTNPDYMHSTCTVTGLERGKTWYFRLRRSTGGGYSSYAKAAGSTDKSVTYTVKCAVSAPTKDKPALSRPTNLKAEDAHVVGDTDGRALLTWDGDFGVGESMEIQWTDHHENFEDNAIGAIQTATLTYADAGGQRRYTVTGLDEGATWYFRVRRTSNAGRSDWATVAAGEWRQSSTVARLTVPTTIDLERERLYAPSAATTPMSCVVGDTVILSWTHNSESGSEQTAYAIELTATTDGTTTTTMIYGGADSAYALVADYPDGTVLSWKVQTEGVDAGYPSAFSRTQQIGVWGAPVASASITELDDGTLTGLPFTVAATASGVSASNLPIAWWALVEAVEAYESVGRDGEDVTIAAGDVVWRADVAEGMDSFEPDELSVSVDAGEVALSSGQSYRLRVGCVTAQGIRAEASPVEFDVEWDGAVPVPSVAVDFDLGDYCARVWPTCHEVDDETGDETDDLYEGVTLSVWRLGSDGETTLIADGIANDGGSYVIDPHPAFGTQWYRVVARDDDTGAQSVVDQPAECGVPYVVVQWDEGWDAQQPGDGENPDELAGALSYPTYTGKVVELPYNIRIEERHDPDVSLHSYMGRRHPVSGYGTQRGQTMTVQASLRRDKDADALRLLRELAVARQDCYVREPTGNAWWASARVSVSHSYDTTEVPVTLELTRVEGPGGEEAVYVS